MTLDVKFLLTFLDRFQRRFELSVQFPSWKIRQIFLSLIFFVWDKIHQF